MPPGVQDSVAPVNPTLCKCWDSAEKNIELVSNDWEGVSNKPYFEWSGANDDNSGVDGYSVYWGENIDGDAGMVQVLSHNNDAIGFTVSTGAATNTVHYLRVKTKDVAGNWSAAKTLFVFCFENDPPIISNVTQNVDILNSDNKIIDGKLVVNYELSEECNVVIKIIDSDGMDTKIIEDKIWKTAGKHYFEWYGVNNKNEPVQDDLYTYIIDFEDRADNEGTYYSGTIIVKSKPSSGDQIRPKDKVVMLSQDNFSGIVFKGLRDAGVMVRIFNFKGAKVRELSGMDIWDGKDDNGDMVDSGVYIYQYEYKGLKYLGTVVLGK